MPAQDFVAFDGASFTYDGSHYVLRDLGLRVPQGQFVCLLGGNGSGKSTLAKCVNALLVPDAGRVLTFGRETTDPDATYFIRSNAGLVFQNPDDQLVASIVENDVAFGPENLGVSTPELGRRVSEALATVGLNGFHKRETTTLSGGQKQRVAIAGILAMDPAMLILDEASAMLDPRGRAGLMRVCRELHASGMTIVMITHYMEEAAEAERVVVLDEGRVRMDGTPADVLVRTSELRALDLAVPFAAALSLNLRERGVDVRPCISAPELACELDRLADTCSARKDALQGNLPCRAEARHEAAAEAATPATAETAVRTHEPSAATEQASYASPDVLLAFQDVSFSYLDPQRAQRRQARKKARRAQNAAPARTGWGASPDDAWALRHIDLAVHAGEFLGIAGHTGSGKSTLIQLMNGLIAPTEGCVSFRGRNLAGKDVAAQARSKVGLVFQYPEYQLFAKTVFDDVAFGPRNQGLDACEVDRRVRQALESVGLAVDAVVDKSPFELSGGQQRRVALAGVLAMEPEMLVLDEPAAGLDPRGRADILALIGDLHARGLTCVMVSHSMDDLARLADRILVLNQGTAFAVGTPAAVFADRGTLHDIGLGVPAAQELAIALRAEGWPLERALYDEDTLADDLSALLSRGTCQPTVADNAKAQRAHRDGANGSPDSAGTEATHA